MNQSTRTKPPRQSSGRRTQSQTPQYAARRTLRGGPRPFLQSNLKWIVLAALLVIGGVAAWLLMRDDKPDFSGTRAYEDVVRQVEFGPRVPGSEAHDRTRQFLVDELRKYSERVAEQPFTFPHPEDSSQVFRGTNIMASFNVNATRRVMLAAHWDTRAVADQDPEPARRTEPVPGANDGASGVAVLLEMARIFAETPPDEGVDILLFDLEDIGEEHDEGDTVRVVVPFAIGSEYFATNSGGYRPAFGILLDMVGDANLRIPQEVYSVTNAPTIVSRVWQAAERVGADAFVDERGLAVYDDHIAFLRRGIPVIDLIQSPFPSYWHTTQDTPDKVSPASLQQVGDVLVEVLYGE